MAYLLIHHVLDTLQLGGAEVLVSSLARLQHAAGHSVVVHCLAATGPLAAALHTAGIPVLLHHAPRGSLTFARLLRAIQHPRPDVVHCHNIAGTVMGAPAARLSGVPCLISTRHGGATRNPRFERKFWLVARLCHRVVAVSRAAAAHLAVAPWSRPDKLTVILNGTGFPSGADSPHEPRCLPRPFTVVSVGRLHRAKDFPTLLRALALASATLPSLRLWILGDGPERLRLESLIAELGIQSHVQLLGTRQDVGRWLAQADLFVLSSVSEGLPLALLEALATGLPAVVTETGGMPEVVQCCGSGLVVPPSQPEALAQTIVELARSPDRLQSLAARARQCYLRHFTLERMAGDYSALYLHILSGYR